MTDSALFLKMFPFTTNQGVQPYKFGDKELDRMYGYDLYDFGARSYDPATVRFTGMDPLAEKYYHLSPYAYCANNTVSYLYPVPCHHR